MKNIVALVSLAGLSLSANAEITFPVERPVLTVGDTFTFQKHDLGKNSVDWTHTIAITGKSESGYAITVDQIQNPNFNGAPLESLSRDLGWKGTLEGQASDAKWLAFPLTQGKTWKPHAMWKNAIGAVGDEDIDYAVASIEDVTVPAGTFKAVKVRGKGWWKMTGASVQGSVGRPRASMGYETSQMDVWYSPDAKAIVKIEYTKNVPSGVSHQAYELTAFKLQ